MTTNADNAYGPVHATDPLALRLSEGLGAWSRSAPTEPGHYWVWQDAETWPCKGIVHCVLVESERRTTGWAMVAWVPFMDYSDAVVCNDSENTWLDALWLGPVARPEAPNVQGNREATHDQA